MDKQADEWMTLDLATFQQYLEHALDQLDALETQCVDKSMWHYSLRRNQLERVIALAQTNISELNRALSRLEPKTEATQRGATAHPSHSQVL